MKNVQFDQKQEKTFLDLENYYSRLSLLYLNDQQMN